MERLVSKNLFNFVLNGVLDKDIAKSEEDMKKNVFVKSMLDKAKELGESEDSSKIDEFIKFGRDSFTSVYNMLAMNPRYVQAIEACFHTEIKVPPRDGNDHSVSILVHTPKRLEGEMKRAAILYAHGGGVIVGSAQLFKMYCSLMAENSGVVVFNVDYRLAPETKCPLNALDYYCALKHVAENASELGVDPSRIAIAGDSGGGYICFSTMVMLAQREEEGLVRLAMPGVPMISDYCFSHLESMTREEREMALTMRKVWHLVAEDFNVQKNDPLLFPAKASDELLQKMPPTIIWEVEFDMFFTEAVRMSRRLRSVGRLLEFIVIPGAKHESPAFPYFECFQRCKEAHKRVVKEYLLD